MFKRLQYLTRTKKLMSRNFTQNQVLFLSLKKNLGVLFNIIPKGLEIDFDSCSTEEEILALHHLENEERIL